MAKVTGTPGQTSGQKSRADLSAVWTENWAQDEKLPEGAAELLHHRLMLLEAENGFIGKDFDLPVVYGEPGSGWRWIFSQNKTSVDPNDVLSWPFMRSLGCQDHEAGHVRITRAHLVFGIEEWKQPGFSLGCNFVEDPRVNNFVSSAHPPSMERFRSLYLDAYQRISERLERIEKEALDFPNYFISWGQECILDWAKERFGDGHFSDLPVPAEARKIFDQTKRDIRAYRSIYPTRDEADSGEDIILAYQMKAARIYQEGIFPALSPLLQIDAENSRLRSILIKAFHQEQAVPVISSPRVSSIPESTNEPQPRIKDIDIGEEMIKIIRHGRSEINTVWGRDRSQNAGISDIVTKLLNRGQPPTIVESLPANLADELRAHIAFTKKYLKQCYTKGEKPVTQTPIRLFSQELRAALLAIKDSDGQGPGKGNSDSDTAEDNKGGEAGNKRQARGRSGRSGSATYRDYTPQVVSLDDYFRNTHPNQPSPAMPDAEANQGLPVGSPLEIPDESFKSPVERLKNPPANLKFNPYAKQMERSGQASIIKKYVHDHPVDDPKIWADTKSEMISEITTLQNRWRQILRRKRESDIETGYETGDTFDLLRRLEERHEHIAPTDSEAWGREVMKGDPDYQVSLGIDLSGSMRMGRRISSAFRCCVLIAESVRGLNIPVEIWGYNSDLIEFMALKEKLSTSTLWQLSGMLHEVSSNRAGATNDGWAIKTKFDQFRRAPGRGKIMAILTDGYPCPTPDKNKPEFELGTVVQEVINSRIPILGCGIGQGTANVSRYYPFSRGNITPENLCTVVPELLLTAFENLPKLKSMTRTKHERD